MFVQEQAAFGLQCQVVVGRDDVGRRLWKQVGSRFADDVLSRQAVALLGHFVDEKIAALAGILHRDLRRYVIDDLEQKRVIPVALPLQLPPFGNVLQRRNPTTLRQRPIDGLNLQSVPGFDDVGGDFVCSDILQGTVEQNCSTSPTNDPVSFRWRMMSRKWIPGATVCGDRLYMSM
jgi:hypothetical protein